jgi:ABC-2 type transport system ATP-binding protein
MKKAPVILTEGLTRQFGEIMAVDDLTLEVYPGEILGFMGHNGAGKTTTVRLLNGVLAPTSGRAQVLGLDPSTEGVELRQRTGVLTETPSVDERLTGFENLAIFGAIYQVPADEIDNRVTELLRLFDLSDRAADRVSGYSKGMKQKLALARALLHKPELIFLDEPTAGLDPIITRQVHTLIQDLSQNQGHSVFLCTHNLEEAQRLCDKVAVLENGKMVALGTPAELAKRLWQGIRLELETTPEAMSTAVQALRTFPEARDVLQNNGQPILSLSLGARNQIPQLVACLVGSDVPLYRLTPQEPTLEDVYFALHENEEVSE